jgi:hypothetical protein
MEGSGAPEAMPFHHMHLHKRSQRQSLQLLPILFQGDMEILTVACPLPHNFTCGVSNMARVNEKSLQLVAEPSHANAAFQQLQFHQVY